MSQTMPEKGKTPRPEAFSDNILYDTFSKALAQRLADKVLTDWIEKLRPEAEAAAQQVVDEMEVIIRKHYDLQKDQLIIKLIKTGET